MFALGSFCTFLLGWWLRGRLEGSKYEWKTNKIKRKR